MFTQTLSKLFTAARPHPWGGAATVRYGRGSDRSPAGSIPSPRNAARGATTPWKLLGLPLHAAFMSAAVVAGIAPAHGQMFLTGSGAHLPLGPIVGPLTTPVPGVGPAYTSIPHTSFTGTWDASAMPAWQGTFTGTGPIPGGSNPSGTSLYDFSGLPGGVLSAGTYFGIADLDHGSGGEHVTLKAYGIGGAPLSTEWLYSPPVVVRGSGSGAGGLPVSADLPGWDWNVSTFTYTFDGTTVPGNPTIAFYLESGLAISGLEVTRDNKFSGFGMSAPSAVPEPSEYAAVAGLALAAFGAWRRTRR